VLSLQIWSAAKWTRQTTRPFAIGSPPRGGGGSQLEDRGSERRQLDRYVAELEALWRGFDEIYGDLSSEDWRKPYGKDWTFADQPFHLAYFDRVIVAEPIEAGANLPERERWTMCSMRDINDWNAQELAKRAAGQTPEQSLSELRESRDRIRSALGAFTDGDLDRTRVFSHFFDLGFISLRDAIETAGLHNWGELSELKFRVRRTVPEPPPAVTHRLVGYYLLTMRGLCRPERANRPLTIEFQMTGPGGGSWTMRIAGGACVLVEGAVERPDLAFRMTPDVFNLAMIRRAINPMAAIFTGKVRIRGLTRMSRFQRLFPQPDPDQPLTIRAST
jgi:SCP-2 sterol transfer family/Mycothiol maleylpyruvate isomerase N-terminal domain